MVAGVEECLTRGSKLVQFAVVKFRCICSHSAPAAASASPSASASASDPASASSSASASASAYFLGICNLSI